jgi:hypothetical protein
MVVKSQPLSSPDFLEEVLANQGQHQRAKGGLQGADFVNHGRLPFLQDDSLNVAHGMGGSRDEYGQSQS